MRRSVLVLGAGVLGIDAGALGLVVQGALALLYCQVLDPGGAGQLGKRTQEAQPTEVLRSEQVLLMRRGNNQTLEKQKGKT